MSEINPTPFIEIKSVSKCYHQFQALKEISLSLQGGRIIGLCGPNGSGKTTLIKILMGLLRDYKGSISINQNPIGANSLKDISYLPDRLYFDKNTKGVECISLFKTMYDDFNEKRMNELCYLFRINPKKRFRQMSKGMQEKLQLALVLSRQAKIYILDEPIGGVDPASREKIINSILTMYAKDSLLLISTHLIAEIENILDEVIFINQGEIMLHENCDEIRELNQMSVDAYFREVFR